MDTVKLRALRIAQILARRDAVPGHFWVSGDNIAMTINGKGYLVATVSQLLPIEHKTHIIDFITHSSVDVSWLLMEVQHLEEKNALLEERAKDYYILRGNNQLLSAAQRVYASEEAKLTLEIGGLRDTLEKRDAEIAMLRTALSIARITANAETATAINEVLAQFSDGAEVVNGLVELKHIKDWMKENRQRLAMIGLNVSEWLR